MTLQLWLGPSCSPIIFTVCPFSNFKMGVVENLEQYPSREMLASRLIVTLNSDDAAYFGGYVNENYQAMQDHMGLDDAILARIARNSFDASFLESRLRKELKAELDAYLAANTVVEQQCSP